MWYKIDYQPNIIKYFKYSSTTRKPQGEPQPDFNLPNCKAAYKNTSPVPMEVTPPKPKTSGKYTVNKQYKFNTINEAIDFAEYYLVPYMGQVRIEESSACWGQAKSKSSQIKLKRYANEVTAARYATVVATPENVPDYVMLIYKNPVRTEKIPIIPKRHGDFFIQLPSGEVLTKCATFNEADIKAKKLTGYDEIWVCQS